MMRKRTTTMVRSMGGGDEGEGEWNKNWTSRTRIVGATRMRMIARRTMMRMRRKRDGGATITKTRTMRRTRSLGSSALVLDLLLALDLFVAPLLLVRHAGPRNRPEGASGHPFFGFSGTSPRPRCSCSSRHAFLGEEEEEEEEEEKDRDNDEDENDD